MQYSLAGEINLQILQPFVWRGPALSEAEGTHAGISTPLRNLSFKMHRSRERTMADLYFPSGISFPTATAKV